MEQIEEMNDIIINNSNVAINDNIWHYKRKTVKKRLKLQESIRSRKRFYHLFEFKKLRIYVTYNIRLRKRNIRDSEQNIFDTRTFKKKVYQRAEGKCELCGKQITWQEYQMHHILPIGRFPEYAMDERNLMCLCHKCHKNIHNNPYTEVEQMEKLGGGIKY